MKDRSDLDASEADHDAKRSTLEAADTLETATPSAATSSANEDNATPPDSASADELEREAQIRIAAYVMAEHRGFAPGFEQQDWLLAERQVDAARESISGPQ